MPSKSKAETERSRSNPNEGLNQMAAANGAAMEIFAQACQAYAAGVATLNGELMGFVNARLGRDVELSRALCRCANWSDAIDLQQDWAQQATREYLAEAGRITDLASRVVNESWQPVYERANKVLTEFDTQAD
jgi:hypothetical protein